MVEQVFGALFLATLFAPAAAVVFGVVLIAWPRRTSPREAGMPRGVSAHA